MECNFCPDGKVSKKGAIFCDTCPAGKVNTTDNDCADCAVGRNSVNSGTNGEGIVVCQDCEVGHYQSKPGKAFCLPCIPGKVSLFCVVLRWFCYLFN